ncbi:unnamed protein product [Lymnaea stagnalis]|uniref:Uncharacterized protein n=1 Tax=Lymnaea stagnalis TaxID=6523 RepID=A0AAV2HBT4_LYMST
MYLIRIILTILIGLTLVSNPHAVSVRGLTEDEERSTGDGTLDDDADLGQGSGDGQQNNVTNATDDGGRSVHGNLERNGTNGSKSNVTLRNRGRNAEKRQRKLDQLTRGGKPSSGNGNSKRDELKSVATEGDYGKKQKKKTNKIKKSERGKTPMSPPRNLPELRALPSRPECPCRKWIPDWGNYSTETFNENGTFAANVCSENQSVEVTEVIAWLYNTDSGQKMKVTVNPSIDCKAHFSVVKNGSYVIQAIAYCPAYVDKNDGDERICDSGSKFSKTFSVLVFSELPTSPVNDIESDRLLGESPDSMTPVLLGCGAGLLLVIILTALICVVRKLRPCKRVPYSSTPSSSSLPVGYLTDVLTVSEDSGNLSNSCITLHYSEEGSTRGSSFQDGPISEHINLRLLSGSPRPDGQSPPDTLTTTSFVQVAASPQRSGISQNPSDGSLRDLTERPPGDSRCVPINDARGIEDLDLNSSPGIVYGPKNDVIKGRFVPLHPSVLSPKETKRITSSEKLNCAEKLNSVESKQLCCGENEPLIAAEKEPLCDTEKEPLCYTEKETLCDTEKEPLCDTEKEPLCISENEHLH